ncbi:hypothetical protein BS47DRAFT_1288934, partial [Hydnum rufescens UP504]
IKVQLAAFLHHFRGSNQHHLNSAHQCNISASTVFLYVDCVTQALGDLSTHFIKWPDRARQDKIHDAFREQGFLGAIGAIDGSLIWFVDVPAVDGSYYYCCKKFYGVCFIFSVYFGDAYDIGWPASQNDITVFKKLDIWLEHPKFFEANEYLLADKGYQITPYTIQWFDDVELCSQDEHFNHTAFNKMHASAWIIVEHSFGDLKGRFPALKWMVGKDTCQIYHSIEALMILANIFRTLQDSPWEIPDFNSSNALAELVQGIVI